MNVSSRFLRWRASRSIRASRSGATNVRFPLRRQVPLLLRVSDAGPAQSCELALRAGIRKPSGEEAAVCAPDASAYGDSGGPAPRRGAVPSRERVFGVAGAPGTTPQSAGSVVPGRCSRLLATPDASGIGPRPTGDGGGRRGDRGAWLHELSHQMGPCGRGCQEPPRPITSIIRRLGQPQPGQVLAEDAGSSGGASATGAVVGFGAWSRIKARSRASGGELGPLASRP